jgi:hypothetical protein
MFRPAFGGSNGPLPTPGTVTVTSHFTNNIVRVGLNYQIR